MESQNRKKNNLQNALSKSSPTMGTLVEKLLNCFDYFLRLSGFPDLSGKEFLMTFKFSLLDYSTMLCKNNANKTVINLFWKTR